MQELIGWGSALVSLPVFGIQAHKQWRSRSEQAPASEIIFFVLALAGAIGQIIYSWMLGNWVYFSVNACLIVTNSFGLALVLYRRWQASQQSGEENEPADAAREEAA